MLKVIDVASVSEDDLISFVRKVLGEIRLLTSKDPMITRLNIQPRHVRDLGASWAGRQSNRVFSFDVRHSNIKGRHFITVQEGNLQIAFGGDPNLRRDVGDPISVTAEEIVRALRESIIDVVLDF